MTQWIKSTVCIGKSPYTKGVPLGGGAKRNRGSVFNASKCSGSQEDRMPSFMMLEKLSDLSVP